MKTPIPSMIAIRQITRLQTQERASTGGSANQPPTMPSTIPIQATVRKPCGNRRAGADGVCGTVVMPLPAFGGATGAGS